MNGMLMDNARSIPQFLLKKIKRIAQNILDHFTYSFLSLSQKIKTQEKNSYLDSRDQTKKFTVNFIQNAGVRHDLHF